MAASPESHRRAAVEMAIKSAAQAVITRRLAASDAVAVVAAALVGAELDAGAPPRERLEQTRRARHRDMFAELHRLEAAGRGRSAATIVARHHALDPNDVTEVESLARWLRRHRRRAA